MAAYVLCVAALFAYLILRMIPEGKTLLARDTLIESVPVTAYAFKCEDWAVIDAPGPLHFSVDEGEKIGAHVSISENDTVTSDEYISVRISAVKLLMERGGMKFSDINRQICSLSLQIRQVRDAMALLDKDDPLAGEYGMRLSELKKEIRIWKTALDYAGKSAEALSSEQNRLSGLLGHPIELTAYNLVFRVYGRVFYYLDGYEDYMGFEDAEYTDGEYLSMLDRIKPSDEEIENRYYIRSSSADSMVLVLKAPKGTLAKSEALAYEKHDIVASRYDLEEHGGYFSLLFERADLLVPFPQIRVILPGGTIYSGKLVKSVEEEDCKLFYIACRTEMERFDKKRIFSCDMITDSRECFVARESCMYEAGGKYFVDVSTGGTMRNAVEVFPYKVRNGKVYFAIDENKALSEGEELFVKGGK